MGQLIPDAARRDESRRRRLGQPTRASALVLYPIWPREGRVEQRQQQRRRL